MTKEEYITDLVSQNLTGKQIVELASRFGEEEVKTEVVADQTGAAVTTTEDTASESLDGKSLSDEEKAAAAVKAKEKEEALAAKEKLKEDKKLAFEEQRKQADTLESGLAILITEKGSEDKPKRSQLVKVNYAGYFFDGE